MQYQVHHETRYVYEEYVSQCFNELHLTPRNLPGQRVLKTEIHVTPQPTAFFHRMDYFGNTVTMVEILERHRHFEVVADSLVEIQSKLPLKASPCSWEEARDLLAAQKDEETLKASEFIYASRYAPLSRELEEYARPTFAPGRSILESVEELSHRIHTEFHYMPTSTSIEMPLLEILRNRRGVCQDFAHIMIAALRSRSLAARYVSGYLRSNPGIQGAEASHAWVAVYIPEYGWMAFDPTNDVIPSDGHVTLAWGRDYGDVTPVKGFTLGGGIHKVEVGVRVEPITSAQE